MSRKLKQWLFIGGPIWVIVAGLYVWALVDDDLPRDFPLSGPVWAGVFAGLGWLPIEFIKAVWRERKKRQAAH